jgi:hypothetical protein
VTEERKLIGKRREMTSAFDRSINDDILCQIFLYLSIEEILIAPLVCRRWKKNVDKKDEVLWNPYVLSLWENKVINQPSELVLRRRVQSLPLNLLKRALSRVDVSRCLEKPDFQNMLIARLIFGDRSPIKRQSRLFYPEWALHLGTGLY